MAFTPFEFVKLDPNALRSITVQNLIRRHGPTGAAVFMAVLIVASRKMDRTPDFECNLTDIGFDLMVEDDTVAAILTDWSAMSEKRGDGFRFTRDASQCRIAWPEFMACYPGVFKHRASGDKRREASGSKPDQTEANGSKGKQTRLEETREEETRYNPPTPLAGGRGAFDAYAPDPNVSGALLQEAQFCLPALKKLCGRLHQRELPGALEKIALVIADLAEAGIPSPTQAVIRTLENWPANVPRSLGIVKQRLHEQVMAASQPPQEEPYDPIWAPLPRD